MQGRFQRGKVGGVSPFFAFQDIITSAMAVLITVVMLLALDMGSSGDASSGGPAPESLQRRWRQIVDQLTDATVRLRDAEDAVTSAKLGPAVLQAQVDSLRAELDALRALSETRDGQLNNLRHHDGAAVARGEIAKKKAATDAARAQVDELTAKDQESREVMERAEHALHFRENELIDAQSRKNEIWLVPDRSTSPKEPVLAIVTAAAVEFERFGHAEKTEIQGLGLRSKFEQALTSYSKADQYIVFYFKPSGVGNFQELTGTARHAGFEIGYDAIGEDTVINFGSAR